MKPIVRTASVLFALIALPAVALADGGPRGGRAARVDTNGDGTVDAAECQAAFAGRKAKREAHHKEMLAKFDKNRDGVLDDSERAAARAAHLDQMFARLDANHDGSISRAELEQGMHRGRGFGRGMHGDDTAPTR